MTVATSSTSRNFGAFARGGVHSTCASNTGLGLLAQETLDRSGSKVSSLPIGIIGFLARLTEMRRRVFAASGRPAGFVVVDLQGSKKPVVVVRSLVPGFRVPIVTRPVPVHSRL